MEQRVNIGGTSVVDKSGKLSAHRAISPKTKTSQTEQPSSLFRRLDKTLGNYRDAIVDLGYNHAQYMKEKF